MRHSVMQTLVAAAIATLAGLGTASAQGVGVEIYSGDPYYYYSDGYYDRSYRGPRVYGYSSTVVEPSVVAPAPIRPDNCGVYHYWNGERCADARVNPPNLN